MNAQHRLALPLNWHRPLIFLVITGLLFAGSGLQLLAQDDTEVQTAAIVEAANAFLASLDETQLSALMFEYDNEEQQENWSNFPSGLYQRAGISYGEMSEEQRVLVLNLLETALSEEGYQKVYGAMVGDEILLQTSSGAGGGGTIFGFAEYYISFLGEPSETEPWILQWGGHHFALNITFVGSQTALSPSHTGCQPCTYIINEQEVSVLGDEYFLARELVNSLDAAAQDAAILDYSVSNLVVGPGEENRVLEPEGLAVSEMTEEQQALLLSIIGEWVNITNDAAAVERMAQLEAELSEMYFAWSGGISETDSGSYFRITGPTLLIEYAPQGQGGGGGGQAPAGGGNGGGQPPTANNASGNQANASDFALDLGDYEVIQTDALYHVHTIYRDPTNPYGSLWIEG